MGFLCHMEHVIHDMAFADLGLFLIQSVDYSAFIRQAFNGDKGLAGAITKLPLEKKFRLQTVKEVSDHTRKLHADGIGAVPTTTLL